MVQYSPKLTFGPETADWQERLNTERMRSQRVARAQAIMKKHGVAALLEANHHNIRYLTALTWIYLSDVPLRFVLRRA